MTIKNILNDVLSQSGFLEQSTFFGSADPDVKQMVSIANEMRSEIRDFYAWPALRKEFTLTLSPGVLSYTLPSDFWRLIPESVWETDGAKQAEWPTPGDRWYMYKFAGFSDGGMVRIRRTGPNTIELSDPPSTDSITFAYLSSSVVEDKDGLSKGLFTSDTDKFTLWNRMLIAGIQARWAEVKMLPQAQNWEARYYQRLNQGIAQAVDGRTIGGSRPTECRGAPYYPLWRTS